MNFTFPVREPYKIVKHHGDKIYYGFHRGIDVVRYTGGEYVSFPVFSPADGTVVEKKWHPEGGNIVVIDHGEGIKSWMAHFSKVYLSTGAKIKKHDAIGESGNTTSAEWLAQYGIKHMDIHLHWHCYENGNVVDPLKFISNENRMIQNMVNMIQNMVKKNQQFFEDIASGKVAYGFDVDKKQAFRVKDSKRKYYNNPNDLIIDNLTLGVTGKDANTLGLE